MNKLLEIQDNIRNISKRSFFKDLFVLSFLAVSIFFLIIIFLIIFFGVKPSDVLVQARFNSFAGVSGVGLWYKVYNIFIVGLFIYIVNSILSYLIYEKEKLASIFLLVAALISELILTIEAINIVRLINI